MSSVKRYLTLLRRHEVEIASSTSPPSESPVAGAEEGGQDSQPQLRQEPQKTTRPVSTLRARRVAAMKTGADGTRKWNVRPWKRRTEEPEPAQEGENEDDNEDESSVVRPDEANGNGNGNGNDDDDDDYYSDDSDDEEAAAAAGYPLTKRAVPAVIEEEGGENENGNESGPRKPRVPNLRGTRLARLAARSRGNHVNSLAEQLEALKAKAKAREAEEKAKASLPGTQDEPKAEPMSSFMMGDAAVQGKLNMAAVPIAEGDEEDEEEDGQYGAALADEQTTSYSLRGSLSGFRMEPTRPKALSIIAEQDGEDAMWSDSDSDEEPEESRAVQESALQAMIKQRTKSEEDASAAAAASGAASGAAAGGGDGGGDGGDRGRGEENEDDENKGDKDSGGAKAEDNANPEGDGTPPGSPMMLRQPTVPDATLDLSLPEVSPRRTWRLEGFLCKRGGLRKNWRFRYFRVDVAAVKGTSLSYYVTKPEAVGSKASSLSVQKRSKRRNLKGSIPLDGAKVWSMGADKFSGREYVFCVQPNKSRRTFFIQASSDEERDQWIVGLQAKVKELKLFAKEFGEEEEEEEEEEDAAGAAGSRGVFSAVAAGGE